MAPPAAPLEDDPFNRESLRGEGEDAIHDLVAQIDLLMPIAVQADSDVERLDIARRSGSPQRARKEN